MCGFVGFTGEINNSEKVLEEMMNTIVHRGPDSDGKYIENNVALGFRRLSILDISNGDQPMFNEDKSLVLVFNGEIYNSKELKKELISKNHVFSNNSDSEVILHGYEEFKENIVRKLRGMFAFVIWDKKNKTLFGARDVFGIKPLYYQKNKDCFLFGSEIKSFLKHPKFIKKLNVNALEQYLSFQYSPYLETFFKGVFKLAPAHYFTLKNNELKIKKYYNINFNEDENLSLEEWVEKIEKVFSESVSAHKASDVEVGSLLSSGVDSSYIACSANVKKTFTVGFSQDGYNEIFYAKELSEKLKAKNYNKIITEYEWWETLPKMQYQMDEPLADASAIALYFACKEASKYVKVILSGEGSDELFGGYNTYKYEVDNTFHKKIPFFLRHMVAATISSFFGEKRFLNYFVRRGTKLEDRYIGNAFIFSKKQRNKILKNPNLKLNPKDLCAPYFNLVKNKDNVTKMQFLDLHMWLVGDILLKADKMSMANSIELRVPFLDKNVLELATKIPTKFRVNKKNTKYALRLAAAKKMPSNFAKRKKLGFPVPLKFWLTQEKYYLKVKEKFLEKTAEKYFNTKEILKLLNRHYYGKQENSRKIFCIYSFLIWHDQYF